MLASQGDHSRAAQVCNTQTVLFKSTFSSTIPLNFPHPPPPGVSQCLTVAEEENGLSKESSSVWPWSSEWV